MRTEEGYQRLIKSVDDQVAKAIDNIQDADIFAPVVNHPRFQEWFDGYEKQMIEAMLHCHVTDGDERHMLQMSILVARAWKRWIISVAQGRKQSEQLLQEAEVFKQERERRR